MAFTNSDVVSMTEKFAERLEKKIDAQGEEIRDTNKAVAELNSKLEMTTTFSKQCYNVLHEPPKDIIVNTKENTNWIENHEEEHKSEKEDTRFNWTTILTIGGLIVAIIALILNK